MQTTAKDYSDKGCLQYWSKIYSEDLKEGQDYSKLNKTICIWILNENILEEFGDYQSDWKIVDVKHQIYNRFELFEVHIFELPKFRKYVKIPSSEKEMWLSFIDHTNGEMVEMACKSNDEIEKAREQLRKIQSDDRLMEIIRQREGYECDEITAINKARREGIDEGIKEGEHNKEIEIARNLKQAGVETEIIMKTTGLSKEEIEKM